MASGAPLAGSDRQPNGSAHDPQAPLRAVVTVQHPADVHFFKHAIATMEADGHTVDVFVRENEVTVELLEAYDIDHTVLVSEPGSLPELAVAQAKYEFRLWRHVRRLAPDVIAGVGGVTATHVATAVGTRGIAFSDTEHATIVNRLSFPFADVVCTPACFWDDIGDKQVRYPGFQELAYLHPDRFHPDPGIRSELGLEPDETVVVLRVSAWDSSHDVGQGGFGDIRHVIETLEAVGDRVIVTSEIPLPDDLDDRRREVAPHRMHDVLATADLYVGEGATMAAESAVLGTPAIYVNTLSMGYIQALHDRYGLLFPYTGTDRHDRALADAEALLAGNETADWEDRRARLLADAVDVTDVIVSVMEGTASTAPTIGTDAPRRSGTETIRDRERPIEP